MRRRFCFPALALLGALALWSCAGSTPAPPADDAQPPTASGQAGPNDELLLASAKVALPPADFNPELLPNGKSYEASLLIQYCGQCHAVPSPTTHSATDWPSVLRRMWLRMEHLPPTYRVAVPQVGERARLLTYLRDNALQVGAQNLPAGPGRDTFARMCSRCHTLPDPRVHSAADWVAVIQRMEQNMLRMNVAQLTRPETEEVLGYLQNLPAR